MKKESYSSNVGKRPVSENENEDEDEEEESQSEEETEVFSSPERMCTPDKDDRKTNKKIEGVVPKDIEQRKEMMSFIAYAQHIENSCKLITSSKSISLCENADKNRIYLSGATIMSTKLTVSLANCRKICEQIVNTSVSRGKIKRINFLEKNCKTQCNNKMK